MEKQTRTGSDICVQDVGSIEEISLTEKNKLAQEMAAKIKSVKDEKERRAASELAIAQQRDLANKNDKERNDTMKEFIEHIKNVDSQADNASLKTLRTHVVDLEILLNETRTELASSRTEMKTGFEAVMSALGKRQR
jgi:hypothetical protein